MEDFNNNPADQMMADAQQVGEEAVDKARGVASDAKRVVKDAANTGRTYAMEAVNAAGKKIDSVKTQMGQTTEYLTKAINDEPVKAVLITAALSAGLTALLISATRGNSRY